MIKLFFIDVITFSLLTIFISLNNCTIHMIAKLRFLFNDLRLLLLVLRLVRQYAYLLRSQKRRSSFWIWLRYHILVLIEFKIFTASISAVVNTGIICAGLRWESQVLEVWTIKINIDVNSLQLVLSCSSSLLLHHVFVLLIVDVVLQVILLVIWLVQDSWLLEVLIVMFNFFLNFKYLLLFFS